MRSLEEWTKYLEQQESELQKRTNEEPEPVEQAAESAVAAPEPVTQPAQPPTTDVPPERTLPEEKRAPAKPVAGSSAGNSGSQALLSTAQSRGELREKLQELGISQDEAAQRSYQGFRETREELIQRLLDPMLTLEDTARLLNVCPTTVRRYTNKGLLKHYRTAGNQRRFRLSDVLAFMESQSPAD